LSNPLSPSELARETLIMLAQHKLAPTPDNYARIYAQISGVTTTASNDAEMVLRGIAEHLLQTPKSAATGIALKKLAGEQHWEQYLKEVEKVLPKAAGVDEPVQSWPVLIRDLLHQLEIPHKGLTLTRKKEGLETVLSRFAAHPEILFEKLHGLIRSWSETATSATPVSPLTPATPPATLVAHSLAVSPGNEKSGEIFEPLREMLAQTLESSLSAHPEFASDIRALAQQVRAAKNYDQITRLTKQLRQFWFMIELRSGDKARIQEGLARLLRLLVENVGELVADDEWLHGQIAALKQIIEHPIDKNVIADAERSLRNTIIKQSTLKQQLTGAKDTLRNLMGTFINRLGELTESTGDYHQKIAGYSQKIGKANHITELGHLLEDIMQDTRVIQASALRSHEELLDTRKLVQESEAKIKQLEQELDQVSELVHQDQLTGTLNRRGLDEAFQREATRADRSQSPLCVALLDIDNFKNLNDKHGHQAGDQALINLSNIIKETLRPSDSVARYGGEEFIIVLPETGLDEAADIVERLQRELTKKFFLHENERILVTFSAGVALRAAEETQEYVVGRADKAMYKAKKSGKNRVVKAD
jgi:diguanylate cyclase